MGKNKVCKCFRDNSPERQRVLRTMNGGKPDGPTPHGPTALVVELESLPQERIPDSQSMAIHDALLRVRWRDQPANEALHLHLGPHAAVSGCPEMGPIQVQRDADVRRCTAIVADPPAAALALVHLHSTKAVVVQGCTGARPPAQRSRSTASPRGGRFAHDRGTEPSRDTA